MVAKDIRITIKRDNGSYISELSSAREVKSILKEVAKESGLGEFLEKGLISDGMIDMIVSAYKVGVKDVDRHFKADGGLDKYFNGDEEIEKITVEVE